MGYGGIFKTVFRIAVTAIGTYLGGPIGGALASAAATGVTGGSFTQALTAGVTTYIGSVAAGSFTEALGGAASGAAEGSFRAAQEAGLQTIGQTSLSSLAPNIFTQASTSFGASSAQEALAVLGRKSLAELGGFIGGAFTGMALEDALNAGIPDSELEAIGFTPIGIRELRIEARRNQLQAIFDRITAPGATVNPGLSDEEFNAVLANGLVSLNEGLGPTGITQQDFDAVFGKPDLGSQILSTEEQARRDTFKSQVNDLFSGPNSGSGELFSPISDDKILEQILADREGPATQAISNFEARGNLNPLGGKTANQAIADQRTVAQGRLTEIGDSVLARNAQDLLGIRTGAEQTIDQFKLGDPLFDVAPLEQQRNQFITDRQGSLRSDIEAALGKEPLFNTHAALGEAGRLQGVVSGGAPNQSLLDTLAAREGGVARRRGLGTQGSGVF